MPLCPISGKPCTEECKWHKETDDCLIICLLENIEKRLEKLENIEDRLKEIDTSIQSLWGSAVVKH